MIFAPLVRGLSESRRVVSARHRSLSISAQKLRRAFDLSSPAAIPHHSLLIAFDIFPRGAPQSSRLGSSFAVPHRHHLCIHQTASTADAEGLAAGFVLRARVCTSFQKCSMACGTTCVRSFGRVPCRVFGTESSCGAVAIYLASTHRHLTSTLKFFSFSQRWSRLDDVVYTSTDVEDLSDMLAVVEVCCSTKDEKSLLCRLFRATCQSVAQFDEFTF